MSTEHRDHEQATYLGFPVSVERTVDLPERLSEEGWTCLVADLRETFEAQGEVHAGGAQRQWRNGHLRALVEPGGSGCRLQMRTLSGSARDALTRGVAFLVVGGMILLFLAFSGSLALDAATVVAAVSIAAGAGSIAATARRLPRWRAERARQMEAIAGRTAERLRGAEG